MKRYDFNFIVKFCFQMFYFLVDFLSMFNNITTVLISKINLK